MGSNFLHSVEARTWRLIRAQHGVVSRGQLVSFGWTRNEVGHRLRNGRLHRLFDGVYAVGRPDVTRRGWWMAATLAAGVGALLSHGSAGALYAIHPEPTGPIHVSIPLPSRRSRDGLTLHRRNLLPHEIREREGIPVVAVEVAVVDLATHLRRGPLETVVNNADIKGLVTVPELRESLDHMPRRAGKRNLRETLDRRTFRFTRSELERAFIPLALRAALSRPETRAVVSGFEVDFHWPDFGLVVETDSLTYHRTAQQQDTDRRRDQAHVAAGLTALRFTHSQIRHEPGYVRAMLASVALRLAEELGRELEQVRDR